VEGGSTGKREREGRGGGGSSVKGNGVKRRCGRWQGGCGEGLIRTVWGETGRDGCGEPWWGGSGMRKGVGHTQQQRPSRSGSREAPTVHPSSLPLPLPLLLSLPGW
jgi:hypothetical protein